MKTILISIFMLLAISMKGQTNESALNRYDWSKKMTQPENGYVVLKSGTKMEGILQLKGNPDNIKKVLLNANGRKLEFDLSSLSSFGLYVEPLVCESPDEMFEWYDAGSTTTMGKVRNFLKTKVKRGYLVFTDGKRIEGMLHLRKTNNVLDEFTIKNEADGKKSYDAFRVAKYGLTPTIADITKNGTKLFEDEPGRNFHPGRATKTDGEVITGVMAFRSSNGIIRSEAVKYQTLYFTPKPEDFLTVIETEKLSQVEHFIDGDTVAYVPFENGFVEMSKAYTLRRKDILKVFHPGSVILKDKSKMVGQISQTFPEGEIEFSKSIRFKGSDGKTIDLGPDKVDRFDQKVKEKVFKSINCNGKFVPLIYDGKTFAFFRNPDPTTINKGATRLARSGAWLLGSTGSFVAVQTMEQVSSENKNDALKDIQGSSSQELQRKNEAINQMKRNENLSATQERNANRAQAAIVGQNLSNNVDDFTIYNTEFFFLNKKTGEKQMVIKNNFSNTIEPLLKSCEKYLIMTKAEQKKYRNLDQAEQTIQMLDECYK